VLYAAASRFVAVPLIGAVACYYVVYAIGPPATEVYALGMTVFGVTAALAAICFSVSESVPGSGSFRYGAEQFLHSSVLLIETVMHHLRQ